jgi:hypothetical protein
MGEHIAQQRDGPSSGFSDWPVKRLRHSLGLLDHRRPAVCGYAAHSIQAAHCAAPLLALAILFGGKERGSLKLPLLRLVACGRFSGELRDFASKHAVQPSQNYLHVAQASYN